MENKNKTFQSLSCQWGAASGSYQFVRAKRQRYRTFVGQFSHWILKSAILGVFISQTSADTTNQDHYFSRELDVKHSPKYHSPYSCPTAPDKMPLCFNQIFHLLKLSSHLTTEVHLSNAFRFRGYLFVILPHHRTTKEQRKSAVIFPTNNTSGLHIRESIP